jgi:UDP:flavonoid glycosyltransferase YjiC (YdhE family)
VGLTAACLSAGVPQVILSKQPDHRASGDFVTRHGLGEHLDFWDATTSRIVDATRWAYDDEVLRAQCRARAPEFHEWFEYDPTKRVASHACRLIGIAQPSVSAEHSEGRPTR